MKSQIFAALGVLVGLSLLLASLPSGMPPIAAQEPLPQVGSPPVPEAGSHPAFGVTSPQAGGGPDEFGYVWDDITPYNWVDATAGIKTGISGDDETGELSIGFPFKFYGQTWYHVYASTNGILVFEEDNHGCCGGFEMPSPANPNNVIAPLWDDLVVGEDYNPGAIYTLKGGEAPTRYFVVEWVKTTACCSDNATDYKTFQVILFENGDIKFQYQSLSGYLGWASVGIEDGSGLDGLQILRQEPGLLGGKAFYIRYPAPTARVHAAPSASGALVTPGTEAQFELVIANNGDLGADTYDLTTSSIWPLSLYHADGTTLLTDTDGDGVIDTGSVAQGSEVTIVVKIAAPSEAITGDYNKAQLTARSSLNVAKQKTVTFQIAIPASFVQSYAKDYYSYADFYRPTDQVHRQTGTRSGYNPVVTTAPEGNIVQVWHQYRSASSSYVSELYYAVLNDEGEIIRPASRLTDNESAVYRTYDAEPAVAVTPNGNMAVVWYRHLYSSDYSNYNIYYLVLDSDGKVILPATNLTDNAQWGGYNTPNVPRFENPTIAATTNNRFVMAWRKHLYDDGRYLSTIWYTVRDSDGDLVRSPAQVSADTSCYYPNLTSLVNGKALLAWVESNQIVFGELDSNGNVLAGLTALHSASDELSAPGVHPGAIQPRGKEAPDGHLQGLQPQFAEDARTYLELFADGGSEYRPDAVQLPNGNIVLAWSSSSGGHLSIWYAVFGSELNEIRGATRLPEASPVGDDFVSVTYAKDQAVFTWGDTCCDYYPNLYYALLDGEGHLLTPPMIFASDNTTYRMRLPGNGQGNTHLPGDITPPTNPISLTSTSHATGTWSNDNTVNVAWSGAADTDSGLDGYSMLWDNAPTTVPDTVKDLEASVQSTSTSLADGEWYFHIRAVDKAGNWAEDATHLGPFKIDTIVPESSAQAPEFALGSFTVRWSGTDTGSGVVSHTVWVRDGASGAWEKWKPNTSATSASYTDGVVSHTYYFRSQAYDAAGNRETDLPAEGDAHTTVAAVQVIGQVVGNYDWPVPDAMISARPAALNTARSNIQGEYSLYFGHAGVYTLTVDSLAGFGALPPLYGLPINTSLSGVDFVLPPLLDLLAGGGWEAGDLAGWQAGANVTPTVEITAAHTGRYGLRLEASGGTLSFWPYIARSVSIPAGWQQPVLSFVYDVVQSNSNDALVVEVRADSQVITHSVPLTPGGWKHAWVGLSAFSGQKVTLRFGFETQAGVQQVYLDEVSLGERQVGVFPVYMPVILRNVGGGAPAAWLTYVNYYRDIASSPPVIDNATLNNNCFEHARYMAETGELTHEQEPSSPWASEAGQICAQNGNVWLGTGSDWRHSIEGWMDSVGHRLWLLYPTTPVFGYGFYTSASDRAGAALDVLSEATFNDASYTGWPVRYPAPEQVSVPTGKYPITLNWPYFGPTPSLVSTSLETDGGTPIAHTADTSLPAGHQGIQIKPSENLPDGTVFVVSVNGIYDGTPFAHSWRFSTGDTPIP